MPADHALDSRCAGAALEPCDGPVVGDENEGGDLGDVEPLDQVGMLVDVDARHAQTVSLLTREVGEQALHSPPRAGLGGGEEEQERSLRPVCHYQGDSLRFGPANGRTPAGRLRTMDGPLDWYLLGVVLGFGVLAGVGIVGVFRAAAWALLELAAVVPGVAVALVALPWWSLVAFAGAALLAFLGLRRLSTEALPAAALGALVLAVIPALGYVAAVATPIAGARLGRRADKRYAGLRVLAKD
jgi:hypothetical protein